MTGFLRQSTIQTIRFGPFIDDTDFKTAETALTIAQADRQLSKDGAAFAQSGETGNSTHDADGWYSDDLTAADTGTCGILKLQVVVAGSLPVWETFYVVEEAIYDALYAASASGFDASGRVDVGLWLGTAAATPSVAGVPEVDVTHLGGVAQSLTDLKDFADAGYDPVTNKVEGVKLVDTTTTNTDVRGTDSAVLASTFSAMFAGITVIGQWLGLLAGKQVANSTALTEIKATGAGSGTYDEATDSLEAIRDRGDAGWVTGAGGSVPDILTVNPLLPPSIDLADTATWRLGLMLTNAIDNLPTTAEITPGTISIDRKASGGTTWSSIVSDAACLEADGLVYFDEVFDAGTGYAAGDSIRVTFKSQKITVAANDHEITGSAGVIFYTQVGTPMRGTDSAALASVCTEPRLAELDPANIPADIDAIPTTAMRGTDNAATEAKQDTAQLDLDKITDTDGVILGAAGVDLIMDEVLTGGTHNVTNSLGKRVRQANEALVATEGSISDVSPVVGDFDTTLTEINDYWEDTVMVFTDGPNVGLGRPISTFANGSGHCTFDEPWPVTPVNGDNFLLQAGHVHPVSEIADAVLDEALAGHTTAGSLGKAVADTEVDVDKITGSDGATLATAQALYAPSKAGDAMTLTSAERDAVANALLNLANGIETGVNVKLALQVIGAGVVAVSTDDGKEFYAMAPGGGSTAGTKRLDVTMVGKNRTVSLLDGS